MNFLYMGLSKMFKMFLISCYKESIEAIYINVIYYIFNEKKNGAFSMKVFCVLQQQQQTKNIHESFKKQT